MKFLVAQKRKFFKKLANTPKQHTKWMKYQENLQIRYVRRFTLGFELPDIVLKVVR